MTSAIGIRGDDRHVLDYLSSEVLDHLTSDQRDLLVRASVLERLSGELCDAALERFGSADVLVELDDANLFVAPLDTQRAWYRCHRLVQFATSLQTGSAGFRKPGGMRRRWESRDCTWLRDGSPTARATTQQLCRCSDDP